MADHEWPSEDEDFDAVTDSKAGRKSVAVVDDEENEPVEHATDPETTPESETVFRHYPGIRTCYRACKRARGGSGSVQNA